MEEIARLLEIIKKLRDPKDGCPWDLKQTHQSLLKYLVEESYEYIDAVEQGDDQKMKDELGDVLLQVVLHAQLAADRGAFTISDVAKGLSEKMIRRHPHVFNPTQVGNIDSDQVLKNWKEIKKEEKGNSHIDPGLARLPGLLGAQKIGEYSTGVHFDWPNHLEVIKKVEEEWQEVKMELPSDGTYDKEAAMEEVGDLLFSVAQLSRHLGFSAEDAARAANKKFIKRFTHMQKLIEKDGKDLTNLTSIQMEEYWVACKKDLANEKN